MFQRYVNDERGRTYLYFDGADDCEANNIVMWYNRREKMWVVYETGDNGYQVGGSTYVYTRREAELDAVSRATEHEVA